MLDIGEGEKDFMSNTINYTEEDIGEVAFVTDFLPSPRELKERNENVKITISLSKRSIDYFKKAASMNDLQYQKLIRQLLDDYVAHQEKR